MVVLSNSISLQQFKLHISNSIINADNSSIKTMNTQQLLDLFDYKEKNKEDAKHQESAKQPSQKSGLKAMLSALPVWDEEQYKEFDVQSFLTTFQSPQ